VVIQQLGFLDLKLRAEEERIAALTEEERVTDRELLAFNELVTLSWLWVLGSYEIVRSLHQYLGEISPESDQYTEEVGKLKWEFEELRIPLAKFEKRRSKQTRLVAWPAVSKSGEVAWTLDGITFTTRRHLAQRFLDVLLARIDRIQEGVADLNPASA
jgi:hypothetical protein